MGGSNSLVAVEKSLDSLLLAPLLKLGFNRIQKLIFQRELTDVRQLLRFPTRLHKDMMVFSANGAIRFERIESLLGNKERLVPTLMMPIHLLRPSKEHFEWPFGSGSSGRLIGSALADCRQYLLPFLERMSVVEAFKAQLLYENVYYAKPEGREKEERLKLVLSPEQRIQKLAAIYVLEGKRDVAEHLIDSELAKLVGGQLPPQIAQRFRWGQFKRALLASG
jgi:hypothetical protein